jgi:hypothetical protein
MVKKRVVAVITGLALLLGAIGATGIAADGLGVTVTTPAHACSNSGSSGGGC